MTSASKARKPKTMKSGGQPIRSFVCITCAQLLISIILTLLVGLVVRPTDTAYGACTMIMYL